MTFEDALYEVCFSLTAKDAREPFFIYSRIADLMGDSYDGKKKLEKFFAVEKRIGILAYVTRQVKGGARGAKENTKKCPILWIAIRIVSSSIICSKAEKASESISQIID